MRIAMAVMIVLILVTSDPARAQVSVDVAQQHLRERQNRRAAQSPRSAGTRPALEAPVAGDADGQTLHDGWVRVVARDYAGAIEMFDRVLKIDPANVSAMQGRGICNYELSNYRGAVDDVDRALSRVAQNQRLIRQATLAAAVTAIGAGNPVRAVRLAYDFLKLEDKTKTLDEEMQNVLGTALWRCKPDARNLPWVREAGKYYMNYDGRLADKAAEGKPVYFGYDVKNVQEKNESMYRWGVKWLPASEADQKWKAYGSAVAAFDSAAAQVNTLVALRNMREKEYAKEHDITTKTTLDRLTMVAENLRVAQFAEADAREYLKAAGEELQKTESPPFPTKLEPVWAEPQSFSSTLISSPTSGTATRPSGR